MVGVPKLQELLAQKKAYLNLLWSEARRLAQVLKEHGADEVYVFGSLAKGGAYLNSDLDLLVVTRTELPPVGRGVPFLRAIGKEKPRVPVDLLVFTPEEMDPAQRSRSLERLLEEGIRV